MSLEDVVAALKKAAAIAAQEEDEAEPYRFKYEAAEVLKAAIGAHAGDAAAQTSATAGDGSSAIAADVDSASQAASSSTPAAPAIRAPARDLDLALAAARVRRGLILLDTDLLPDGEAAVQQGLAVLETAPDSCLAWVLESYNALGALYSQRGSLEQAIEWLQKAEGLYQKHTGSSTRMSHLPLPTKHQAPHPEGGQTQGLGDAEAAAEGTAAAEPERPNSSDGACTPSAASAASGASGAAPGQEAGGAAVAASAGEAQDSGAQAAAAAAAAAEGGAPAQSSATPPAGPASAPSPGSIPAAEPSPAPPAAPPAAPAAASTTATTASSSSSSSCLQLPSNDDAAVQAQYTSTLYFMAQVYGHLKLQDRSALYCAATLYRQLASGKYDLATWVNNCLQLGGYYAKVHAYALAHCCHAAAKAVLERDVAAGAVLDDDIAANVALAAGRVLGMRLAASHARHVECKQLDVHYPDISHFPDYLRFPGLPLPSPDSFPWGEAALASTFEAARDLFNSAMPYFKEALSYYQLDGWVTDHVGILMDMSNMYRCLAGFEPDPSRSAAMHRCRAQLLEPLSGALSTVHYPGLSRSIDLELAHVWREVSDTREAQGGHAAKASSAAASAAKHYQRFLHSFHCSDTGQLPERIDHDNEPYFLMASFGLGRMLHRMRGATGSAAASVSAAAGAEGSAYGQLVVVAHKHLQWTSEYVRKHKLESWMQEAQAAEELSELLVEQMRLRAMTAAQAARKGS